ncbi:MAG: KamA family radical SAM protein [Patescibacteria group bacterium]
MLFFKKANRHIFWKRTPSNQWMDWRWQITNRVTDPDILQRILGLSNDETRNIKASLRILRMAITPYYLSQIEPDRPDCPIRLQAIPTTSEAHFVKGEAFDPLHEEEDCPEGLEGVLTHRYPDRMILYTTYQCAMYCRHCTRRRHAGETDLPTPWNKIKKAVEYMRKTKSIRDVLISGGDPFTLSTSYLEKIIREIRTVSHIEIIRIGTRTPVTLPMRIDEGLCSMLKKYHPIWVNVHFNHPKEMTDLASLACAMMVDHGIPLGNQSVLLRRVNNHPLIMKKLVKLLVANRVRPYYIYQCDLSQGIEHFRTRISEGIEIIEYLRGHTTGFAVPTFVVDGIGGGGKVPIGPNYVVSQGHNKWVFRNYEGVLFSYVEPVGYVYDPPSSIDSYIDKNDEELVTGVSELLSENGAYNITPKDLARLKRRHKKL